MAQQIKWLQQGLQQAFLRGAGADEVGTYSINGRVEVVEADVGAVEGFGADDFLEEVEGLVVHEGHMVGVPADGTADMQHQFGHIQEQRRNHVGDVLGGFVMARVEGVDDLTRSTEARVEVVRADGETLQSDAEEFGLDAGFHVGQVFGQDFIQGFSQQLTVASAFYGEVFQAVVYPDVHDARVALCLAHGIGDATTAFGMLDPESADGWVGVGEAEFAALGMAERGAVEVELHIHRLAPVDPALEVLYAHLVAVDELAAEVAVDLV